ncbi:plastocyanin/azurin family copper-binding protein [Halorussus salilacus]|uniref:plastocyanin/azurin family copper-binding protein n=1 Tax=Halorussus salilacus TaxID=2953750 RepID=UPI0020A137AE|nr:plastocyanin/azurin family copper-binding protein [Halorussus salilacus]USZ68337.1 plastocyanin/azurin family copper-binding protein [Halorussus salilacus]
MKRRTFVSAASAAALAGLAGCGAPTGDDGNGGNGGEGDGATTEEAEDGETTEEEDGETTEGTETTTEDTETTAGEDGDGGGVEVAMITEGSEYYFDPIGLAVEPGTTVTFVNESGAHSSTAYAEGNGGAEVTRIPEDAEPWDSETISEEGATFEHTFEVEGTYDYFCIPHKTLGMVGRIVVGEPGGPGEEGMPPDGEVPDSDTIVEEGSVSYEDFSG